jgi:glycosyltransferase involved in cell wall biosynthesis
MKIAQISPLFESVPPKLYGGTERIVSYLTEELVSLGHDVTLFASADSQTSARLVAPCQIGLRLNPEIKDPIAPHVYMLEQVVSRSGEFELIHSHIDYLTFPFARRCSTPVLTTLHGRLDLPEVCPVYEEFNDLPVVSISNAQRVPCPDMNWRGTVYHGIPHDILPFHERSQGYLAFLGRFSHEKRVDRAIQIAEKSGLPLKIAAKVDPADLDYYNRTVKPLLKTPGVECLGEINDSQKSEFLGNALALVFPIDWPEPFGLVLLEAMACGTPVIAFRRGSVPEIIEDGVTGFVVDCVEEAVEAVGQLPRLCRDVIRQRFEDDYSVQRMAQEYLQLYEKMVSKRWKKLSGSKISSTS